jgi:hypothetical protein
VLFTFAQQFLSGLQIGNHPLRLLAMFGANGIEPASQTVEPIAPVRCG